MEMRAIILVGHGSSMPHNKEVVSALADKLKKGSKWDAVSYSFMNMNTPSIKDAIENVCQDPRVTSIVMAPVFVAPGVHIKE
ncbi:MAG TPA: CbiX/SirB N-terminal domain-containing protein, partial [Candidatus Methanofastidiosa archaeon]|nr:CbiX/SirB N-terminal domain-containing protein [Candidatus Methanofastidiosa archaeon]